AYKIKSPYITTFPEVKFRDAIPYNFVEYETQIPDFFGYNIYQKGYETFDKKQELKVDQIELKHSRKNSSSKALGVPGSTKYLVNYNSVYTTYTAKDVKSFSNESFTNNIDNYTSSIFYELSWEEVPG